MSHTGSSASERAGASALDAEVDGLFTEVDELFAELRRQGFDLRRGVFLTYVLDVPARAAAYDALRRAEQDGWQASIFRDAEGWVVRLVRTGQVRRDGVLGDHRYVERLARQCGADVRGVAAEQPLPQDPWELLAARQRELDAAAQQRLHLPTQRRGDDRPAARAAVSRTA